MTARFIWIVLALVNKIYAIGLTKLKEVPQIMQSVYILLFNGFSTLKYQLFTIRMGSKIVKKGIQMFDFRAYI